MAPREPEAQKKLERAHEGQRRFQRVVMLKITTRFFCANLCTKDIATRVARPVHALTHATIQNYDTIAENSYRKRFEGGNRGRTG